jgi:hypothetical protein
MYPSQGRPIVNARQKQPGARFGPGPPLGNGHLDDRPIQMRHQAVEIVVVGRDDILNARFRDAR